MPQADFETYFHDRARRFAAFYGSERIARLLGRGPLFDRLRGAVEAAVTLGAERVLDVGCGSGPLFDPLCGRGIAVVGIDPAAAMVALAEREAARFPGLATVEARGWEELDDVDAFDLAVALGVFDYVADAGELLRRMGRAAPAVVASFPAPGLRLRLRQVRYGARGVSVHGYRRAELDRIAAAAGLQVADVLPLGRAGYLARFSRAGAAGSGPPVAGGS